MNKIISIFLSICPLLVIVVAGRLYDYLQNLGYCEIKGVNYYFGAVLFVMGVILFVSRMKYLKNNKNDEYNSILREFDYLRHNTHSSLIIGIGVSTALVGVAVCIYKPVGTNVFEEKIFEIITLYLSILATLLVIRAIFERIGPITEVEKLLKRLKEDFEENSSKRDGEAYIVYPALNIGNFREESELVLEKYYSEFSTAVETFAKNQFVKLTAITYKKDLYEKMYAEYSKNVLEGKGKNDAYIEKKKLESVREATRMFDNIKNASHLNSECYELTPKELREHFIIINDIVYT